MANSGAHAHKVVAEAANGLCNEVYDLLMLNNEIRAEWKRQHPGASEKGLRIAFLKRFVDLSIAPARATLAGMLAQPYDETLKESILEALVLDNTLKKGRADGARVIGAVE